MVPSDHPPASLGERRALRRLLIDNLLRRSHTFDHALPIFGRADRTERLRLVDAVSSDLYAEFTVRAYLDSRLQFAIHS
jgi:hypothetical protein